MFFSNERGVSLVEVMFAVIIFMIIMLGGLTYFTLPQSIREREKMRRLAVVSANHRMETLMALDFTAVTSDSNETNTPVTIGKVSGTRNTTVTDVDDAADGTGGSDSDGDTIDYRTITIDVKWNDGKDRQVTLTTKLSEFGNRDF